MNKLNSDQNKPNWDHELAPPVTAGVGGVSILLICFIGALVLGTIALIILSLLGLLPLGKPGLGSGKPGPSISTNSTKSDSEDGLDQQSTASGINISQPVKFANSVDIAGNLTAPNILYGLVSGKGIYVSPGQTPTIANTGVLSFQGTTGDVSLLVTSGLAINGTTLSLSAVPNSVLANSRVIINTSGNLTGGGTVNLGDSLTLNLVANPSLTSATISGTLGVGGEASISSKLIFNYLGNLGTLVWSPTGPQTVTVPDATGTLCLTTGNCSGIGGIVGGSGTQNYVAKWNNADGTNIGNSIIYDNGSNVGIGTTSPAAKFQLFNASNTQTASISATNGLAGLLVDNTIGDLLTASSSGLSRFVITQNGNVGIGTTTPGSPLSVSGFIQQTVGVGGTVAISSTPLNYTSSRFDCNVLINGTIGGSGNDECSVVIGGSSWGGNNSYLNTIIGYTANTAGDLNGATIIGYNASHRANNGSGVAVGRSATTDAFGLALGFGANVNGSSSLAIGSSTSVTGNNSLALGAVVSVSGNNIFAYGGSAVKHGFGTSSPLARLDVRNLNATSSVASISGSTNFAALVIDNTIGDIFTASSSGLNRVVIKQNGNVGIGTTNPADTLHVQGSNAPGISIYSTGGAGTTAGRSFLSLLRNPASFIGWQVGNDTNDIFKIKQYTGSAFVRDALTIDTSGNAGIGTTAPTSKLQVFNSTNTQTASISATNGLAGLLVDNTIGDLFTASSSGLSRFVITQNGNVGIGTTAPGLRLDVRDSQSATATAMVFNTNNGANTSGLVVKLGFTGTGASTNHYINFLDNNGNINGSIQSNGANGVTYAQNGIADFAEYMKASTPSSLPTGTLVCQSNAGVVPCDANTVDKAVGIRSDHPAFLGGINTVSSVIVGLVGQIPVRIAPDSATVSAGDFLTASATHPGMAKKATVTGYTVAKALEAWSGEPGRDTILGSINLGYYSGDSLAATTAPATTSAQFNAPILNLASPQSIDIATMSAQFGRFTDSLQALGKTQLSDTTVGGKLIVGLVTIDDVTADVSSMNGLLSFQQGTVKIDGAGNINTSGSITANKINIREDNTASGSAVLSASIGQAVIPTGQTRVEVKTTAVTAKSQVFTSLRTLIDEPLVITSLYSGKSFVVEIAKPQSKDVNFSWWIVN